MYSRTLAQLIRNYSSKKNWSPKPTPEGSPTPTKVLLLGTDKNVLGSMSIEDAEDMARKRQLKLEEVTASSSKEKRQVFQLVRAADSGTDRKNKEKIINIGHKISDHDLGVRITTTKRWLSKGFTVRVTATADDAGKPKLEMILERMTQELADNGEISQKQMGSNSLRFVVKAKS